MKFLQHLCEICGGLLVGFLSIFSIMVGGIFGLIELPMYLKRMKS